MQAEKYAAALSSITCPRVMPFLSPQTLFSICPSNEQVIYHLCFIFGHRHIHGIFYASNFTKVQKASAFSGYIPIRT